MQKAYQRKVQVAETSCYLQVFAEGMRGCLSAQLGSNVQLVLVQSLCLLSALLSATEPSWQICKKLSIFLSRCLASLACDKEHGIGVRTVLCL